MKNRKDENKTMKQEFLVIPSVRDVKYIKYTQEEPCKEVLLSNSHIGNLKQLTANCHQNNQKVIVNHELIGGLGNDRVAFEMLKKLYKVDGVIGSNVSKLNQMQHMGLETIFRISLIDSHSVDMALRSLKGVNFTALELRPYYHAVEFLPIFQKEFSGKFFAGGFINSEEKVKVCREAGFDGIMTSTRKLWGVKQ